MRAREVLAAILLAVGLSFVPGVGHGEIEKWKVNHDTKASYIDVSLLRATVSYMMTNPTNFLDVISYYDPAAIYASNFPGDVVTKGKIFVMVHDSRGVFSGKSGVALVGQFKKELEIIYSFLQVTATNMRTDIVAKFYTRGGISLGYFYQGEYHLWEE